MNIWNDKAKRILKSELVKRGISNSELVILLREIGQNETKASVDSKISRGTFSACFFLQCLNVIGCKRIDLEEFENKKLMAAEPKAAYNEISSDEK